MKGLAELVVSLCDLCEAEGRLLEAGILRTVRRAGLLSLGLLFGAAALALLLAALYALLTALLPTPAALACLGCASAAIAGFFLWRARGGAADPTTAGQKQGHAGEAAPAGEAPPRMQPPVVASGQKPESGHDPWAGVPPYGHGARGRDTPGQGPGTSPKTPALGAPGRR